MVTWGVFAEEAPEIAAAGERLFRQHQVAFLATIRRNGAPRIHPVVPIIADKRLWVFIPPTSPKHGDLLRDRRYALHALLGEHDEEFTVRGYATAIAGQQQWLMVAEQASYSVGAGHVLFELHIETCLWGIWERVGQPDTRAVRRRWPTRDTG